MKKKILFISPLPPPYYGSAISSQSCLSILQKNESFETVSIKLNHTISFNQVGKFSIRKVWGSLWVTGKVIWKMAVFKPDLVYIMPATEGYAFIRDYFICLITKLFNIPIVYHLRTRITSNDKNHIFKNILFKLAFHNCKVIVLGKELVDEIRTYFLEENIYILPNAIESTITEKEFATLIEHKKKERDLRILFLSNMMKSKGWPKVLELGKRLKDDGVNFMMTFAGSWPSLNEELDFYAMVKVYNLSNHVNYIGHVNQEQKKNLLSNSDILLFPTEYKYETFGRVNIEAMEYGIPVIASAIGSIPSIIDHKQTGFLLYENSVEELNSYITAFIDRKEIIRQGENARKKFLTEFELSILSRNLLLIIEKMLLRTSGSYKMQPKT